MPNALSSLPLSAGCSSLLSALAHPQAVAHIQAGGGAPAVIVHAAKRRIDPSAPSYSLDAFEAARTAGWITDAKSPGHYRLSRAGRFMLRAQLPRRRRTTSAPSPVATTGAPQVNEMESPLAWLRGRRGRDGHPLITEAQFDAGERLRADLHFAQLTPRVTASWSEVAQSGARHRLPAGFGLSMSDRVVAAKQRVNAAFRAVGIEFIDILFDVCGHLKGLEEIERRERWPQRSAKIMLQKALTALARHYGLIPPEPVDHAIARRIRHWGAPDYRPSIGEA